MPASQYPMISPLTRETAFYPGQFGVQGSDNKLGLRQSVTGTAFYVDPNFPDANDSNDGTNPYAPKLTIQGAVNACLDYRGDVIYVMMNGSWQYAQATNDYATPINEAVTLNKAGVRLIGVSSSSIGVPWYMPAAGLCVHVTAIDCTIEGFAFCGGAVAGTAILADWTGVGAWGENLSVRNCYFDDDIDIGIEMEYSWYNEISRCYFDGCDTVAIVNDIAKSASEFAQIHDNTFMDCAVAMDLREVEQFKIYHNSIYNAAAQSGAAATNQGIDTTGVGGSHNLVEDNFLSCPLAVGYADFCSGDASDAWINNHCMTGDTITIP